MPNARRGLQASGLPSEGCLHRGILNLLLDTVAAALLTALVGTGYLLVFVLPPGTNRTHERAAPSPSGPTPDTTPEAEPESGTSAAARDAVTAQVAGVLAGRCAACHGAQHIVRALPA